MYDLAFPSILRLNHSSSLRGYLSMTPSPSSTSPHPGRSSTFNPTCGGDSSAYCWSGGRSRRPGMPPSTASTGPTEAPDNGRIATSPLKSLTSSPLFISDYQDTVPTQRGRREFARRSQDRPPGQESGSATLDAARRRGRASWADSTPSTATRPHSAHGSIEYTAPPMTGPALVPVVYAAPCNPW